MQCNRWSTSIALAWLEKKVHQRSLLLSVFSLFIFSLLALTTWASLERNVFDNAHLLKDRWFLATLMDAYWGFFTVSYGWPTN